MWIGWIAICRETDGVGALNMFEGLPFLPCRAKYRGEKSEYHAGQDGGMEAASALIVSRVSTPSFLTPREKARHLSRSM